MRSLATYNEHRKGRKEKGWTDMMLKREIKILDENRDAIVAALREVNGRAQSHAVTSLAEVRRIAEIAELEWKIVLYLREIECTFIRHHTGARDPFRPLAK